MSDLRVESRPDPQRRSVPVRFGAPSGPFEEVEAVLDWWPGEAHHYFRVRVRDGAEYILRQDLATGAWRVDFFRWERHSKPLCPGVDPSPAALARDVAVGGRALIPRDS